jgi:cytochrome b
LNNEHNHNYQLARISPLLTTELQPAQMLGQSLALVTHTHRQPAHAPASRVMVAMAQHCSVMVGMDSLAETAATLDSSVMAEQVVSAQQAQPELSALVQFFPSVTAPTQVQVGMAATAVVAV